MTSIAIIGTAISATLVVGIIVALALIGRKVAPPVPKLQADQATEELLLEGEEAAVSRVEADSDSGSDSGSVSRSGFGPSDGVNRSEAPAESLHG